MIKKTSPYLRDHGIPTRMITALKSEDVTLVAQARLYSLPALLVLPGVGRKTACVTYERLHGAYRERLERERVRRVAPDPTQLKELGERELPSQDELSHIATYGPKPSIRLQYVVFGRASDGIQVATYAATLTRREMAAFQHMGPVLMHELSELLAFHNLNFIGENHA